MYKKFFILVLLFSVLIGIASMPYTAYGANTSEVTMEQANEEAIKLNKLGLLQGTGHGFALEEIPTRLQGLIMLVRMMGEEKDALNCKYTHPFTDVPEWGDRYVAWAYHKKYTNGTSATTFSSYDPITAQQYLAFTLRAMGYGNDTTYQTAIEDARRFGIIPPNAYEDTSIPFLRADMIHITYLALQANEKTTNTPFYLYLIDKGTLDAKTAISIFNPELSKLLDEDNKNSNNNQYDTEADKEKIPLTPYELAHFLGYNDGRDLDPDSIFADKPDPSPKYYSYTNTNNDMSSYTVSIDGNQIVITGKETTGLNIIFGLKEIISVDAKKKTNYTEFVVHKSVDNQKTNFRATLTIPDLKYSNYFELYVSTKKGDNSTTVMERIWVKGSPNNWYFEGPSKIKSNETLMKAADNYPIKDWNKQRNITNEFKEQIINLIGKPESNNYNTAYKIILWLSKNIVPTKTPSKFDALGVLETRKANCKGFSNLMVHALAVYDIPARIAIGEIIFNTPYNSFVSIAAVNHAWVEFYDSESGRWVVCDPTYGIFPPSCWFDLNRDFIANGMKVVRYE